MISDLYFVLMYCISLSYTCLHASLHLSTCTSMHCSINIPNILNVPSIFTQPSQILVERSHNHPSLMHKKGSGYTHTSTKKSRTQPVKPEIPYKRKKNTHTKFQIRHDLVNTSSNFPPRRYISMSFHAAYPLAYPLPRLRSYNPPVKLHIQSLVIPFSV